LALLAGAILVLLGVSAYAIRSRPA
jgi:hypothetical protein